MILKRIYKVRIIMELNNESKTLFIPLYGKAFQ